MPNKDKYRLMLQNEPSIPLYVQDWWLDCVCGAQLWDVLLYENDKGEIEAAMPIYTPCKGVISMPPFTQSMGIWFKPEMEEKKYSKNLYRKQLIGEYFINRLPEHNYFLQNFHYSFTDWLPFYWKEYRQTTRYNYVLPDIRNLDDLRNHWGGDVKRNIGKAQKKYHIEIKRNIATELFMRVNTMTYERQKMKTYHPELLQKVIETARSRNQGDIWGAYDADGNLYAAVFLVWQNDIAYYIAAGADPRFRQSGAHAAVLWQAIQDVATHAKSFDFGGSMVQGIEHFFREFGAVQMPYYTLSKGKLSLIRSVFIKLLSK